MSIRDNGGVLVPTAFPRNPAYGRGVFRRRIRLVKEPSAVVALLDDTNHSMWCRVRHDGEHVTATEGNTIRAPNTNCPGASAALSELVGLPLAMPRGELFGEGRSFRNCTHLFDLAALSMAQAMRDEPKRTCDIIIPDETDEPVVAQVLVDGRPLLQWRVTKGRIVEFGEDAPIPIMRGFTGWALAHLEGETFDAAMLLQRGYLVSGARQWIVDRSPNLPITALLELAGACYAYQPERIEDGVQAIGNVLDFTEGVTEIDLDGLPGRPESDRGD
jgi:hypothetical protein